ncbi:unnamed protein product, partial [Cuscuta campestris]
MGILTKQGKGIPIQEVSTGETETSKDRGGENKHLKSRYLVESAKLKGK